jgi:hypothetical protein
MRTSPWAVGLGALLATGCGPSREAIVLELDPAAAAYVLGYVRDGALSVYAIEPSGAGVEAVPTVAEYVGDSPIELVAYAYDVPLSALGVSAGELVVAGPDAGGWLPRPPRIATRTIDDRGAGEWVVLAGESDRRLDAFRSLQLPRKTCATFQSETVTLTGAEDPLVAMVPSTDGVLVFTGTPVFTEAPDSELWRVRYDVTPPQAERLDALPGLADLLAVGPVVTAVRGPDDRIWVSVGGQTATGMPKHEVWVGTEQGGFAPLPVQRTYSTEWMWWLVADQGPRGPRLWALTDYGSVDRYEEATGTWTRLAGPTDQPTQTTCVSGRRHCGGLVRALDGTLIVAHPRYSDRTFHVRDDELVAEPMPPLTTDLITVASTPLGPVAVRSTVLSTAFARRDEAGTWTHLAAADGRTELPIQRTYALSAWGRGFLASGVFGFAIQHDGDKLCPAQDAVVSGRSIGHVVTLPGALALSAGHYSNFPVVPPAVSITRALPER